MVIGHDEAAELARLVLELRQRRVDHVPADLLGEHSWGILLALFIADAEGRRTTAADLFMQAQTPRSAGRRWMQVLIHQGLVASDGICDGANIVSLTAKGLSAVEACMADARDLLTARREVGAGDK